MLSAAGLAASATGVLAGPIDFGDFDEWFGGGNYPPTAGFAIPVWEVRDGGDTVVCVGNAVTTIYFDGSLETSGQRITGTIFPGTDDDIVGLALGYNGADEFSPTADYLYIDWKGVDQEFDFVDIAGSEGTFHDVTGATVAPSGIRVARVRGTPTADEFWGAVDLPENDDGVFAPGGVTQLARAIDLGRFGYDRDPATGYQFDIDLTPTNLKVWVNGVLQFDVDAPPGEPFDTTGFGVFEQYQDSGSFMDQGLWTGFSIDPSPGTDPDGSGLTLPSVTRITSAANIDSLSADNYPASNTPPDDDGDTVPDEEWWEVSATTGASPIQIVSLANRGDVAFNANGAGLFPFAGVGLATMRENRVGDQLITCEIVPAGQFGIAGGMGVAIAPSPQDPFGTGNEANADFAIGFFAFAEGWIGASVTPSGTMFDNPADAVIVNQVTPSADDQDGLYDLSVDGISPATGLLFVVGASNEDNVAAAIPFGAGWRVGVRDNGAALLAGPEIFERDDFAFLYVPHPDNAGDGPTLPVGAAVTGFDVLGDAQTILSFGSYTLTRDGAGTYRLSIPGENPGSGMLLLTANASMTLDDPDDVLDDDTAPMDLYPSYAPDGSDFVIQLVSLTSGNVPADGAFSFAFVPFGETPCRADLNGDDDLNFFDVSEFLRLFNGGNLGADFNDDGELNFFDVSEFLQQFNAGC